MRNDATQIRLAKLIPASGRAAPVFDAVGIHDLHDRIAQSRVCPFKD